MGKVLRAAEEQLKSNVELMNTMTCPHIMGPCIGETCWQYRGSKEFWPERELIPNPGVVVATGGPPIPATGHTNQEVEQNTGRVLTGVIARCGLQIFPQMVMGEEVAEGYKVNDFGEVTGADGVPLRLAGL